MMRPHPHSFRSSVTPYALRFLVFLTIEMVAVYGLKLDTLGRVLQQHWQFADLHTLAKEPFTAWIYIHTQPPLLNIILAAIVSKDGSGYNAFILLNCVAAATTSVVILYILNQYTTQYRWLSYCFALAYLLAPSTLLYSAYPFYPTLTSAGYAILALAIFTSKSHKTLSLLLLNASLTYLMLLRSSFPPIIALMVLTIYFTLVADRVKRLQRAFLVAFCCLIPITAIYTKNLALYDFWGSTSFAPINAAKGFGVMTELNYFPSPDQIISARPDLSCDRSYHAIDRMTSKQDGNPNYNSCYFLAFAQSQQGIAWKDYEFKNHLRRVVSHFARYLSLPDRYQYLTNRTSLETYADIFNSVFLPWPIREGYTIRVGVVLLMLTVFWLLYRQRDKRMIALCAICAVHMLSHVVSDGDESDRFVFDIEFCFYIFAAYALLKLQRAASVTEMK